MADFTFEIHSFNPEPPVYNIIQTKMEGWRIKRRLKSSLPQSRWSIEIRGRTNAEKDAILAHYTGQTAGLTPFNWTVTPAWFDSTGGSPYYVTYESFSYTHVAGMNNIWNFEITFLEELP